MNKFIFLFVITFITESVFSQIKDPFTIIKKRPYVEAYIELTRNKETYAKTNDDGIYKQAIATLYSIIGRHEEAYNIKFSGWHNKKAISVKADSIEISLLEMAQNYNVILINEAHHIPKHRAFLYYLLPYLKSLGYNQLAIEALSNKDTLLNLRGYPLKDVTGYYTNEPVFANVIRKAKQLGFKLISYDYYGSDNRHERQADNIYKAFDRKLGKLIIFSGYSNGCFTEELGLMGYRLKQKLGIDILSISQTRNINLINKNISNFILVEEKGFDNCFNYDVIHNTTYSNNIASWYKQLMNFKVFSLKDFVDVEKFELPVLIKVCPLNKEENIPYYQYLLADKDKIPDIAYPNKGKYWLIIEGKTGVVFEKEVLLK